MELAWILPITYWETLDLQIKKLESWPSTDTGFKKNLELKSHSPAWPASVAMAASYVSFCAYVVRDGSPLVPFHFSLLSNSFTSGNQTRVFSKAPARGTKHTCYQMRNFSLGSDGPWIHPHWHSVARPIKSHTAHWEKQAWSYTHGSVGTQPPNHSYHSQLCGCSANISRSVSTRTSSTAMVSWMYKDGETLDTQDRGHRSLPALWGPVLLNLILTPQEENGLAQEVILTTNK